MNWRRIVVIVLVVVFAIWGFSYCAGKFGSGTGSMGSPTSTVKSAIMAFKSKDTTKVTPYFTPMPGAQEAVILQGVWRAS